MVVGDAPLADTSSPAPGGCRMSGFYTFHPVTLTEPEPTGGRQPLLPGFPFRSASEPSLVSGYVSNSRPASALELKRRLSLRLADIDRRSDNTCLPCPPFQPKLSKWPRRRPEGLRRQEELPMRRLTSRFQLPSVNRLDRPKVAIAVPRMPRLPLMSAPMSEDTAAGHEPPARHGLPEAVCVDETVTRLAAPDDPAQTALPRKGVPKNHTAYRLTLPGQLSNRPKTAVAFPPDDHSPLPCRSPRDRFGSSEAPRTVFSKAASDLPSRLHVQAL